MKTVAGWRIQVTPQCTYAVLSTFIFMDVEIADEASAIAFARNRPDATPGERVYSVRSLSAEELHRPAVTGL